MPRYGNMAPGYWPLKPNLDPDDEDEDKDEDDDLDLNKLLGKSTSTGVTYGPPQKDEYGRTFRMGSHGRPAYDPAPPKTQTYGPRTTIWTDPDTGIRWGLDANGKPTTNLSGASGGRTPTLSQQIEEKESALGRPLSDYERQRLVLGYAPPSAPQGRDLRMTEGEAARLGLDREEFGFGQEKWRAEFGRQQGLDEFSRQKFEEENADRDRSFDYGVEKDTRAEEFAREKLLADQEYRQATMEYQQAQDQAEMALKEAQLTADREYKQALIDNARAELEEKRRQFEIAEARARRAQAEVEKQNRINNMFEASERTGLVSSGILNLGNNAPGYEERIGILSGYQR